MYSYHGAIIQVQVQTIQLLYNMQSKIRYNKPSKSNNNLQTTSSLYLI